MGSEADVLEFRAYMPSPLAALRYRDFAAYVVARIFNTLAWQMLSVAVGWQVYHLTSDPLALGLVGLAQFLPFLLVVLPAGHVVDRTDRRLVMLAACGVSALCAGVLLWFTWAGGRHTWPIYSAMAVFGIVRAFWMPAGQAMTPNLVPPEAFPNAVALSSMLMQAGVIAGPVMGGLLYLLGPGVVYATALGMLVIAGALIGTIRRVRSPVREQAVSKMAQAAGPDASPSATGLLEGVRFILRRRVVLGAMTLDLFAVLFGGATALLPVYARDVLHVGPAGLGALRTSIGMGAGLTSLLLAFAPIQRQVGRWMFGGVALYGLAFIVFGLSSVFSLSLLALFIAGAGDTVSVYIRHILVQLETPDAIRGRVSAVSSMFIGASNELGDFESGLTASWFGTVPAVVLGGGATLLVVAAHLKWFPELRRMDRFARH
jgi:MFS family permease